MKWSLHEGESLRWLDSLGPGSVDALITDPPYSSGGAYRGDRAQSTGNKYVQSGVDIGGHHDFEGDTRDQRSFTLWCAEWLTRGWLATRPGGVVAVFCDWRQLAATTDAVQMAGWVFRGVMVWDKTRACRPNPNRPSHQAEYVVWGSRGPLDPKRDAPCLNGVITHRQRAGDKHHQTGKPTPVMRQVVQICERGGLIVDPFAGSASTGVAALLEGYRFAGCELSPAYAEVARVRLAAADRGATVEFGGTGEQPQMFAEVTP